MTDTPTPPGRLSVTEYARHRRIGISSVRHAIETHRIDAAIEKDGAGKWWIVDAALADREWEANRRPKMASRERESATDQIGEDADPAAVAATDGRSKPARSTYLTARTNREQSSALKEAANAEIAQMTAAKLRGDLIDAAEVRAGVADLLTQVKGRLLGLSVRIGQEIPEIGAKGIARIDALIRETLDALADNLPDPVDPAP